MSAASKECLRTEMCARMQGALVIEGGVDITNAQTLGRALWRGVTQTAITVGPVFGKLPGGGMGCVLIRDAHCVSRAKGSHSMQWCLPRA